METKSESLDIRIAEQRRDNTNTHSTNSLRSTVPTGSNFEVNPFANSGTYGFTGARRVRQSGDGCLADEASFFAETMEPLHDTRRWDELIRACDEQIEKTPDWLTPYLYSAIALNNTGKRQQAIERLKFVEERAGDHPDYAGIKAFRTTLERRKDQPRAS